MFSPKTTTVNCSDTCDGATTVSIRLEDGVTPEGVGFGTITGDIEDQTCACVYTPDDKQALIDRAHLKTSSKP